jgi:acid phosphatase family membrane protein YuiD
MNWIDQLLQNNLVINGFFAWITAQVLKTIINAIISKKFDLLRIVGDGGMPSSHSATVTAVATTSALTYGLSSFQFGVTMILAFIVMHDAMGVRLETGKQSKVLNQMIEFIESMGKDLTSEEKLKEFVGHTPMQVIAGATLGVLIALFLS